MQTISMAFSVPFSYPVQFTQNLFDPANPIMCDVVGRTESGEPAKCLYVLDENVHIHHPQLEAKIRDYSESHAPFMKVAGPITVVPGGEASKNSPQYVQDIIDLINDHHIDRHSYVVAIGGGAVIDMVGYAAAVAHRGIRLIRVPTTVLAQNDAAVGVKNSVNAYNKKNFLGTFAPPHAVLCDYDFLNTLDQRDWIAGISEAVKVALLKDATFFEYIRDHAEDLANRDLDSMKWVVYRCAELHLEHIATSGDPFEKGSSRPLDFGHWMAHKLEQLTDYELRHGEAVATGIVVDCIYASRVGSLSGTELEEIIQTFVDIGFDLYVPELEALTEEGERAVFAGLREFQEHLGGQLTISILDKIGQGREIHEVDLVEMDAAINTLRRLNNA